MHIAHLSDLHLAAPGGYAIEDVDVHHGAAIALAMVRRLLGPHDCLVVTGDIAANGAPAEYRQFAALIEGIASRILVVPGNHDDRVHLRRALQGRPRVHIGTPDQPFIQYAVTMGGLSFVALDTLCEGQSHGELCAGRLAQVAWLLQEHRQGPLVLLMHHPPTRTGIQSADTRQLGGAAQLGHLLRGCRQLEAVLCGHAHRHVHVGWGGVRVICAPSTAYLAAFDPRRLLPASFSRETPGFLWHEWHPGAGLATYAASIESDDGVQPFKGSFGLVEHR